jgi:hypothetical protein
MEAVKAGKEISVQKYVVRLSKEEGEQLETLIRKGKGPARRLHHRSWVQAASRWAGQQELAQRRYRG